MAQAQGWTLVQPAAAPPPSAAGWTLVQPAPDFKAENEKDGQGNATTSMSGIDYGALLDHLTNWLPAIGGTVGGVAGTVAGPAGAVGGAALGGAAGEAYKELIQKARYRTPPGTAMQAVTDMAKESAIQGGSQALGTYVIGPAASAIGERVMQSAVKPGLKYLAQAAKTGETPRVVQTLLDEGVNVTPGGVEKLRGLIETTNDRISSAVKAASGDVSPYSVASRLTDTARTFANQVNPQADLDAISQVGENFLDAHGGAPIANTTAQALKRGTYARIGEKYGTAGAASIEAEKALARGLKEEIAANAPNISALNAREGKLLEALDVVGKRVALSANRDPVGFAWAAHNPTTFLAALIDRNPTVKSLLARGLFNHAAQIAQVAPMTIRVAVHALATDDPQAAIDSVSSDQGTR